MTSGNPAFCLALCLTGIHFRGQLHHVDHVSEQKSSMSQLKLEKYVLSDFKANYMYMQLYLRYSDRQSLRYHLLNLYESFSGCKLK